MRYIILLIFVIICGHCADGITEIILAEYVKTDVKLILSDQPGDIYNEISSPPIGRVNVTMNTRASTAKDRILDKIQSVIPQKSTDELVNALMTDKVATDLIMYYVARDGNTMLIDEIKKRKDPSIKSIIEKYKDKVVFTGINGPLFSFDELEK